MGQLNSTNSKEWMTYYPAVNTSLPLPSLSHISAPIGPEIAGAIHYGIVEVLVRIRRIGIVVVPTAP